MTYFQNSFKVHTPTYENETIIINNPLGIAVMILNSVYLLILQTSLEYNTQIYHSLPKIVDGLDSYNL